MTSAHVLGARCRALRTHTQRRPAINCAAFVARRRRWTHSPAGQSNSAASPGTPLRWSGARGRADAADRTRRSRNRRARRAGRLTQAVTYGGFGPTDLASALGASIPAKPGRPEQEPTKTPPPKLDAKQRRRAEQTAAEDRGLANQARQAAESAEEEAEAATQRADDLADQVESLRGRLRQAEAGEREAREAARVARKHYQELRQAATAAEQTAAAADEALGE